jgi:hypothetical protein
MSTHEILRKKSRRYRLLAQSYEGIAAERLRASADELERQAVALEAYSSAAQLGVPHRLILDA